ncbi:integrase [Kluyvera cryocrescens]|uniref:Integrase n=1 Tax=Kluyvera cryocrescens TaxID=580 RepID=A0A485AQE6_KLUCR|nr:integrase [Kluyvera cryocrescens]
MLMTSCAGYAVSLIMPIKLGIIDVNPAAAFDMSDAGGKEQSRSRWLTRAELVQFFEAMRMAKGFSRQNELTMKLLLVTCVRKMELCAARWSEFDLANGIWYLPGERTKDRRRD